MTFPRLFYYSSIALYEAPRLLIDLRHTNTILIDWHHYTAITNTHMSDVPIKRKEKHVLVFTFCSFIRALFLCLSHCYHL